MSNTTARNGSTDGKSQRTDTWNLPRNVRVDLRSYERQGLDIIPTVHMGPAVTEMERKGIATNIGNLNRDIKAANRLISLLF